MEEIVMKKPVEITYKHLRNLSNIRLELDNNSFYRFTKGVMIRQYIEYTDGEATYFDFGRSQELTERIYRQIKLIYRKNDGKIVAQKNIYGKLVAESDSCFVQTIVDSLTQTEKALIVYEMNEQIDYEKWVQAMKTYWYEEMIHK